MIIHELLQKIAIALSVTIYLSINIVIVVNNDKESTPQLVPYNGKLLGGLYLNQTFEGRWSMSSTFESLKRNHGMLRASILQYSTISIQNNVQTKDSFELLQLKLYDSDTHFHSYVLINLKFTHDEFSKVEAHNWPSELFNIPSTTQRIEAGNVVDSWNINYEGSGQFDSTILIGTSTDVYGQRTYLNASWDSQRFTTLKELCKINLNMKATARMLAPWTDAAPAIKLTFHYADIPNIQKKEFWIYSCIAIFVYFINWILILLFFSNARKDENVFKNLELSSLFVVLLYDIKIALFNIFVITGNLDLFNKIFLSMISLLVFCCVSSRLLFNIWSSRKLNAISATSLKHLLFNFGKFILLVGCIASSFLLIFQDHLFNGWTLLAAACFLIPQILRNLTSKDSTKFYSSYFIGNCALKYCFWVLIAFFKDVLLESDNIRIWQAVVGTIIMSFTVLLLFWQKLWGPKSISPAFIYILNARKTQNSVANPVVEDKASAPTSQIPAENQTIYYYVSEEHQQENVCASCGVVIPTQLEQNDQSFHWDQVDFVTSSQTHELHSDAQNLSLGLSMSFCGHSFHTDCLNRCVEANECCPQCQKSLIDPSF